MTADIKSLKLIHNWLLDRIAVAILNDDKKMLSKRTRQHKQILTMLDKQIFKELHKVY